MSKKQKLINRLYLIPKDFTYNELKTLLKMYGFEEETLKNTSGSRVMFINKQLGLSFRLHKPHPSNILKIYQVKELVEFIKKLEENYHE